MSASVRYTGPRGDRGDAVDETVDAAERGTREAVKRLRRAWPRESGRSAAAFRTEPHEDGPRLVNDEPYSAHVRRGKGQPALATTEVPVALREEIRRALQAEADDIAEAALGEMMRGLSHG